MLRNGQVFILRGNILYAIGRESGITVSEADGLQLICLTALRGLPDRNG